MASAFLDKSLNPLLNPRVSGEHAVSLAQGTLDLAINNLSFSASALYPLHDNLQSSNFSTPLTRFQRQCAASAWTFNLHEYASSMAIDISRIHLTTLGWILTPGAVWGRIAEAIGMRSSANLTAQELFAQYIYALNYSGKVLFREMDPLFNVLLPPLVKFLNQYYLVSPQPARFYLPQLDRIVQDGIVMQRFEIFNPHPLNPQAVNQPTPCGISECSNVTEWSTYAASIFFQSVTLPALPRIPDVARLQLGLTCTRTSQALKTLGESAIDQIYRSLLLDMGLSDTEKNVMIQLVLHPRTLKHLARNVGIRLEEFDPVCNDWKSGKVADFVKGYFGSVVIRPGGYEELQQWCYQNFFGLTEVMVVACRIFEKVKPHKPKRGSPATTGPATSFRLCDVQLQNLNPSPRRPFGPSASEILPRIMAQLDQRDPNSTYSLPPRYALRMKPVISEIELSIPPLAQRLPIQIARRSQPSTYTTRTPRTL